MDRQRIEGGVKKATGTVKEKAGKVIGYLHLESEGKAENAEGHLRSGVGKAMDAVREIVNSEKDQQREGIATMRTLMFAITTALVVGASSVAMAQVCPPGYAF